MEKCRGDMLKNILALALLLSSIGIANQRYNGYCQQGGKSVVTAGVSGTPKVQGSYPQCQISVFLTGTLTLATLFSDNAATPKANPFTANTDGSFYWYAANGRYDVRMSGGGLPAPVTLGDVLLADPATGGTTVSSITAGAGISVNANTGAVTVTNTWGALPAATGQLQYLRTKPNAGNNTTMEFQPLTTVDSSDYYWILTATGAVTGGVNSTITIAPVPLGVNFNNGVNDGGNTHQILISGGGGPTEVCYIVSAGPGTAVSGATSGTLTINCPTGHTTGATIQSNSNGIQEALYATTGGRIHIPTPSNKSAIPIYGGTSRNAITIPCVYDWEIYGDGPTYSASNGQTIYPQTTLALALQNGVAVTSILGTSGACGANVLNLNIHDLAFRGAAIGDGVNYGAGVRIVDYIRLLFRHNMISRVDGQALVLSNSYGGLIENNFIVDNGSEGISITGALANVTRFYGNSIATNCRVNASNTCSNVTSTAAFITLDFVNNDIESCGSHPWSGSVTLCNNLTIGGSGGQTLNIQGSYMESPHGNNAVNVQIGSTVTSGYIGGNSFLAGGVQFNYTVAANSFFTIGTNSFNKNACVAGNCGAGLWFVGDTGVRNHFFVAPQELLNGSVHIYGSAYVGEFTPYSAAAAPAFTGVAGDFAINTAPGAAGNWGWAWNGAAFVQFGKLADANGDYQLRSVAFASLPSSANGTVIYCSNCNATCTAGGGTGRTCFRENGAWTH